MGVFRHASSITLGRIAGLWRFRAKDFRQGKDAEKADLRAKMPGIATEAYHSETQ
jgi:hypothetical protein